MVGGILVAYPGLVEATALGPRPRVHRPDGRPAGADRGRRWLGPRAGLLRLPRAGPGRRRRRRERLRLAVGRARRRGRRAARAAGRRALPLRQLRRRRHELRHGGRAPRRSRHRVRDGARDRRRLVGAARPATTGAAASPAVSSSSRPPARGPTRAHRSRRGGGGRGARERSHAHVGVCLGPCIVPTAGVPTFELPDGEMDVGMGVHGESGLRRAPIAPADEVADELLDMILADGAAEPGDPVLVLVNTLGATPRAWRPSSCSDGWRSASPRWASSCTGRSWASTSRRSRWPASRSP